MFRAIRFRNLKIFNGFSRCLNENFSSLKLNEVKLIDRFVEHLKLQVGNKNLKPVNLNLDFGSSKAKDDKQLEELLKNQENSPPEHLLVILLDLMENLPHKITYLNFYQKSLQRLVDHYKETLMTKEEFIKLIFLIGQMKKNILSKQYIFELTAKYLDLLLDDLTTFDFAILCSSFYKTSTTINNSKFRDRLLTEIEKDNDDIAIFVTFLKSFRQNKLRSKEVILKIKEMMRLGKLEDMELRANVHCFSVLAESRKKDDELINFFISSGLKTLNSEDTYTRMKDWAKFLYCCCHLNAKIDSSSLQEIENLIEKNLDEKRFKKFDHVTDAVLSLRILGQKRLAEKVLKHENFSITNQNHRTRIESRLKILQTIDKIDKKSVEPFENAPKFLIRDSLRHLKKLLEKNGFNDIQIVIIENLWIAGIVLDQNLFIEVLDDSNCLSNRCVVELKCEIFAATKSLNQTHLKISALYFLLKRTPIGIFGLKIKLLRQMGKSVVLVDCKNNDFKLIQQIKNITA